MQRERERERERFETDRGREHGRRTIERSQSPSHIALRRPASPTASPSLSERIPSDSDRRICCRSSDRSGSCSSVSPPRFEKLEKARTERYNKADKLEKDRLFEVDRGTLVEKEKRAGRKDRAEKDKSEKQRLKKLKVSSPVIQPCEPETELEPEVSPDAVLRNKSSKTSKEGTSKGRLDLLPCVVQLTRVKEKEGKLIGHSVPEKQNLRGGNDSPRIVSPSADQRSPPFRTETLKSDISKHGKVHRDKNSLIEFSDKDAKIKSKKHGKSEIGFDSSISVDIDRLAARKRRFEDTGKGDRLKRSNEEELVRRGLHKVWSNVKETDLDKNFLVKGMTKTDHHKDKTLHLMPINSPREGRDCENESISFSSEHQPQLGEAPDECSDQLESHYLKMDIEGIKSENSSSLTKLSEDYSLHLDEMKEQPKHILSESKQNRGKCRVSDDGDELTVHTGQNDTSKHAEQTRWLKPKFSDPEKSVKFENPPPNSDFEKDYILHGTVKSSRELPTDDISCKRKKYESFDFELGPLKRESSYSSTPKLNEELYQNVTPSISQGHCSATDDDETSPISVCKISKERKSSLTSDEVFSNTEASKSIFGLTATHFQSSETELTKLKTSVLGCDDELVQRWARRMKSDSVRMDMNFSSDVVKNDGIRKCLGQDLEPGEVQSDSDDDGENKPISPKSSSSLSYILRERDERMSELKLSASLEKNKFYSFALDKTITPDTKALLERAKTLYSSREDNWSFLPSRFPTSHNCTDKDKVELTPRPIPSWYMKKKKIRTGSDEKLLDKKEELKPQDQERQDLFASRFLHSSIFEQDSRRLQHLERKDADSEIGVGRQFSKPRSNEVNQAESATSDVLQEPKVLFHSRFLELQQQKDKEHLPIDSENDLGLVEIKTDENSPSDKEGEPVVKTDEKSLSQPVILSVSPCMSSPKELSSPKKKELLSPASEPPVPFVKMENEEKVLELSSSPTLIVEDSKPFASKLSISPSPVLSEPENDIETKPELIEHKVKVVDILDPNHLAEDKPPIPSDSLSGVERKAVDFGYSDCTMTDEKPETIKLETQIENQEPKHLEECLKTETDTEMSMPELQAEIKPAPSRRQTKGKRSKQLSGVRTAQPSQVVLAEKPATRKSERIDKEKLKRASSPRAEAAKTLSEAKTTAKSPVHASDSELNLESSLIHGRTRRRNVRSVYATLHEDDQAGKEVIEPSRSMRKRGADKEPTQQDVLMPSTNHARRGRPPKRGVRRLEDISPVKGDSQKILEEETEIKETSACAELVKVSEGWRSPRTQKLQQTQIALSVPVNKKGSRPDKQSGSTLVLADSSEAESQDESKLGNKDDSELSSKLPEKVEHTSSLLQSKEKDNVKDTSVKKSICGTIENVDSSFSERKQQPEKGVKVKMPRLKRNSKQTNEEKCHSLKNLEIRVSVDDVKGLLRPDDDTPEAFKPQNPAKSKIVLQEDEEIKIVGFVKESKQSSAQEREDSSSEPEPPPDPAALLARQMELERAVENIAKLAAEQAPRTYKEQPPRPPAALPPAIVEPEVEAEEEKRANPASETELAAAIDSITAEETCADADSFTTHPTYSTLIPTSHSVSSSSSSNEIMEPETHMVINNILAADSDDSSLGHSPPRVVLESKVPEGVPQLETPKKTGKVKAKAPKKQRGRKGGASKKADITGGLSQPDSSPVKLPESIPEDPEMIKSKAVTVAGATVAASVVTAVATCRRDVTSAITVDTPKEAEQPDVEQPVPKESAFHSSTSNSGSKKQPPLAEPCTPTLASAVSTGQQAISQLGVPLLRPAKMPISPDWPTRTEESRIYVAPSCHVTVVTPSAPPPVSLGAASTNPPKPPDTKASDIDSSSSTLRKILMEPKYVSASNNKSVPTTMVTSALSDPSRMSENEKPSEPMILRPVRSEERLAISAQSIHHKPFPLTESQQNSGERTQHTVISPTTSVISRIPMPYDTEETPRISLSNQSTGLPISKQKFRTHSNENNRCHGHDVVEESNRGHSVVETTPYSSSPGLRVNTSEGVVVLSYSGQKTEGPHRMRAKISQIPQASAGDLEFQQSVTKPLLKQDPLNAPSQSPTPKVSSSPAYGHTGVLLTGQSYNAQPVISSTKQEVIACDKPESLYHTASQGGVVKMFQQPVSSPPVLMYNQAVIQQHGKRSLMTEPVTKKIEIGKTVQQSNHSPVMSPHHPSSGTRMSPSPGTQPDRLSLHLKQEPQSPRTTVHSPLPFVKSCPPTSSPRATSVVLGHGISTMSSYHSSVHHPHSEPSSVIIQPHSVNQGIAHESRMNTQPVTGINYGRRSDSLSSAQSVPPQRSNTPQPNAIRDIVLQSHSSAQRSVKGGGAASIGEEDSRHFNQALSRPSVPQLKSDVMMIHGDHRGLHPGIRMDQYRDMHQRVLMHQQLGEQGATEARQSRTSETGTVTSSNISGPSKSHIVAKNIEAPIKESLKPLEGKLIHSSSNESRIRGVHTSSPIMVSPHPHGVQLMCQGGIGSYPVYREMRSFPSQFSGHTSSGHGLTSQGMANQGQPEPDLGHRSKISQSHGGGSDSKPETSHLRRAAATELSHISRIQGDTISPSYQSPMTSPMSLSYKPDLSLQNGPPPILPTPPPTAPPTSSLQSRDGKLEHSGPRSIDTVQLLTVGKKSSPGSKRNMTLIKKTCPNTKTGS